MVELFKIVRTQSNGERVKGIIKKLKKELYHLLKEAKMIIRKHLSVI